LVFKLEESNLAEENLRSVLMTTLQASINSKTNVVTERSRYELTSVSATQLWTKQM